jgi:hypothetical protein
VRLLISAGQTLLSGRERAPAFPWSGEKVEREFAMEMTRAGAQPSANGPGDRLTGTVRIDPLFQAPPELRVRR